MTPADVALLLAIGLVSGLLAGLLGIGGGLVIVPAMVLLAGFDQHIAQGTSLLVIIPAASAGSWTHYRHGRLDLRDAAALAAGGVVGALLGSVTALALDEGILRRLFAVLLVLVAIRMLVARRPVSTPEEPEAD
jgi:hypothetical protein